MDQFTPFSINKQLEISTANLSQICGPWGTRFHRKREKMEGSNITDYTELGLLLLCFQICKLRGK